MNDFRHILRTATRPHHERVDARFSRFDIRERDGYAGFLQAQLGGHLGVASALQGMESDFDLGPRIAAIRADLRVLGASEPMAIPTPFRPKQALGFIYVIAGSLHGVNVLRRVWSTSTDHRVLSASNFMDYSDLNAQWARLLGMFNATSFSAADQARIISAAQAAFDIFERAASAVRPEAIEA